VPPITGVAEKRVDENSSAGDSEASFLSQEAQLPGARVYYLQPAPSR